MFNALKLHEFFLFDVEKTLREIKEYATTAASIDVKGLEDKFNKNKYFSKDHYFLFEEKFIRNLGCGP